ncbi:NAD(P)H-hydrate dehydratase [Candidatus Avelusimicrobium stercoris]|uniref:NAD(P)H-hydrate dehydratase n=1 Tax=Candidatus Avelusimicrobium stercoris TaxID=1947924 RepID=UPI003D0E8F85
MNLLTPEKVHSWLPVRPQNANKGTFGRVLVVAGSRTMCGAGYLCAKSALLAGAGLVFWALPESMQPAFAAALPEVITLPMPETEKGELSEDALYELTDFMADKKPSLAVVGPGMGKSSLLIPFLQTCNLPLVADADALNALAQEPNWTVWWPKNRPCIFTPHPGEMARLLHTQIAATAQGRVKQVEALQQKTGNVCLLKGANTLVSGHAEICQNPTGGPALAKAGSGDVLSGVIAGLWAQLGTQADFSDSAFRAACCGVYLHGLAGDLAARKRSDYGVLASDTASCVPEAICELLK